MALATPAVSNYYGLFLCKRTYDRANKTYRVTLISSLGNTRKHGVTIEDFLRVYRERNGDYCKITATVTHKQIRLWDLCSQRTDSFLETLDQQYLSRDDLCGVILEDKTLIIPGRVMTAAGLNKPLILDSSYIYDGGETFTLADPRPFEKRLIEKFNASRQ